jgi:hypothetical protein
MSDDMWETAEAERAVKLDRARAREVTSGYGPGGELKPRKLPAWGTLGLPLRLMKLVNPRDDQTAGPEEARALEQVADLPVKRMEDGRYKIDSDVWKGEKTRTFHFIPQEPSVTMGAQPQAAVPAQSWGQFQAQWNFAGPAPVVASYFPHGNGQPGFHEPVYAPNPIGPSARDSQQAVLPSQDPQALQRGQSRSTRQNARQGQKRLPASEAAGSRPSKRKRTARS